MLITQTPLRISFLGGGTDYPEYFEKYGGAVLGTAVDKCAYFAISRFYSKLFDYSIRIAYRKVECVSSLNDIEHAPFRECMRWTGLHQDVEINHSAELPAGTGLGSSSSFTVGLLNTIYAYKRKLVPSLELAYEAIDIERNVLKESVGVQDQTFAAVGGFNLIEFRSMGNFVVNRVPFSPIRLEEFEKQARVIGFKNIEISYEWFLGQGDVMHGRSFQDADTVEWFLRQLSPISDKLFKYIKCILVK